MMINVNCNYHHIVKMITQKENENIKQEINRFDST